MDDLEQVKLLPLWIGEHAHGSLEYMHDLEFGYNIEVHLSC